VSRRGVTRARVALALLLCLAAACVSAHTRPAPAPLRAAGGVGALAVLLHRYEEGEGPAAGAVSSAEASAIEARLGACVRGALAERALVMRVVTPAELAAQVFPGVPLERVPRSPEAYVDLSTNAEFRARARALDLRHVMIATGATQMPHTGGIGCFGGYGGAACLGLVIWHRESRLAALVLDLVSGELSEGPSTEASGHAWLAALGIFPLGMPSGATRAKACEELGAAVADALAAP
jgi:hypothetical protein